MSQYDSTKAIDSFAVFILVSVTSFGISFILRTLTTFGWHLHLLSASPNPDFARWYCGTHYAHVFYFLLIKSIATHRFSLGLSRCEVYLHGAGQYTFHVSDFHVQYRPLIWIYYSELHILNPTRALYSKAEVGQTWMLTRYREKISKPWVQSALSYDPHDVKTDYPNFLIRVPYLKTAAYDQSVGAQNIWQVGVSKEPRAGVGTCCSYKRSFLLLPEMSWCMWTTFYSLGSYSLILICLTFFDCWDFNSSTFPKLTFRFAICLEHMYSNQWNIFNPNSQQNFKVQSMSEPIAACLRYSAFSADKGALTKRKNRKFVAASFISFPFQFFFFPSHSFHSPLPFRRSFSAPPSLSSVSLASVSFCSTFLLFFAKRIM